jgi:hypothetical protein
MQLTEAQAQQARQWVADGMKLSEFQKRLETDFGIRVTYMEVRLLVDDLKVLPKDSEPAVKPEPPAPPTPATVPAPGLPGASGVPGAAADGPVPAGGVSVTVDTVTRPGSMASGSVRFSDGQTAQWYLDQAGRFGMVPTQRGYRPSQEDVQEFQLLLDREFQKLGF